MSRQEGLIVASKSYLEVSPRGCTCAAGSGTVRCLVTMFQMLAPNPQTSPGATTRNSFLVSTQCFTISGFLLSLSTDRVACTSGWLWIYYVCENDPGLLVALRTNPVQVIPGTGLQALSMLNPHVPELCPQRFIWLMLWFLPVNLFLLMLRVSREDAGQLSLLEPLLSVQNNFIINISPNKNTRRGTRFSLGGQPPS